MHTRFSDEIEKQKQIVNAICELKEPKLSCGSFSDLQEAYNDHYDDHRKERLENAAR